MLRYVLVDTTVLFTSTNVVSVYKTFNSLLEIRRLCVCVCVGGGGGGGIHDTSTISRSFDNYITYMFVW